MNDLTPKETVASALELGFDLSRAVAKAIEGGTLAAFADRHGFAPEQVTMCIRGYEGREYPHIRDRLAEELGTEREWLDAKIEEAKEREGARETA